MTQFITDKEACRLVGISRAQIWRLRRAGLFPQPVQLSMRRIAYVLSEIETWMKNKVQERDAA